MPIYNQVRCLDLALTSLVRQTAGRDQFEVIVVDDASVQDVRAVVRRYESELRLRYVRQESNRGRSAARNLGVAQSRADWLLLMDGDSYAAPDLVERHLRPPGDTSRGRLRPADRAELGDVHGVAAIGARRGRPPADGGRSP